MKRWIWAIVLIVIVVASGMSVFFYLNPTATAEEKRPITLEDIYQLRTPVTPVISPNGEWVAFRVKQIFDEGWHSYIGIALSEGNFEWVSSGPHDSEPIWSPDSKELLYCSGGELSILKIGEKEMIHTEHIGIKGSSPRWSSDRRFISYISDGQLHLFDLNTNKTKQITSIDGSVIFYIWSPVDNRIAFSSLDGLYLWEENKTNKLTESDGFDLVAGWSPGGDHIAFTRMRSTSEMDVYVVTPDGEEKQLTDQQGMELWPKWSPDDEWLVYNYIDINELKWMKVWVVDLDGNRYEITADFERSSWLPLWSSNSNIYFRAENEGTEDIYESYLNKSAKRITDGEKECIGSPPYTIDVADNLIAYTSGDVNKPTEVYVYDLESETKRQITHLNDNFVNEVKLLKPVEFWFNASDGTTIQGWYLKPEGEGKYPLIMEAHGGPHFTWWSVLQMYYGFDFQVLAAKGYGVAWINPRGSIGYDREFVEAIRGAWGINDAQDFLDGIDYLIDQGWVDENNLGFTGISYGGYMTNWMITHTDRFKAAVSEAGMSNLTRWYSTMLHNFGDIGLDWEFYGSPEENPDVYERCSPITYVENVTTPTLFIHGVKDLQVAVEESEEMVIGIVENSDASVAFVRYPDEYHTIVFTGKNYIDRTYRMINWFDSYLMVE
jgi:dipeptidyl aminopeptidase/acylaminoacyl peptidase